MRRLNYCKKIAVAGTVLALCANGMLSYAAETGTITTMSEKIYDDMSDDGTVVGNVIMGSTFSLLDAQYDSEGNVWYKVETDSGVKGYIRAEKVANSNQAQSGVPVATQTENTQQSNNNKNNSNNDNNNDDNNNDNNNDDADNDDVVDENNDNENNAESIQQGNVKVQVVAAQTVNIRQNPSTDADIVAKMPQGTTVDSLGVYEDANGEKWYEVSYIGIEGYVMDKVVDTIETTVEVESETNTATQTTTNNTTTNKTSSSNKSTTNSSTVKEEKIEESSTASAAETEQTKKSKFKFHFYIDWVAIFSLIGSLLCIGMIVRLMNTIKKLEK
jgi:hypothetical protein